ncbi:MAG: HAD family hydrolase, partial [Bacteroidaceae bacterium]|nr:HAD family hydrolase [Bacteroidaceae bacterium]
DYLICIDSDGCAMDTMDIKHFTCFGPCMVKEWQLEEWEEEILTRWNDINLYTMTRGINRFKGLAMALGEINEKYKPIEGCLKLKVWADGAKELSNQAVEEMYNKTDEEIFKKALSWSKSVNENIQKLPDSEKKPFEGAKEGLKAASKVADVAIVSSANVDAVVEEWKTHGLLEYVDVMLCQDAGSKAFCIKELVKKGYDNRKVLMVGDAPGDLDAAKKNLVNFYPILVRHEKTSWEESPSAFEKLKNMDYESYGKQKEKEFIDNLSK